MRKMILVLLPLLLIMVATAGFFIVRENAEISVWNNGPWVTEEPREEGGRSGSGSGTESGEAGGAGEEEATAAGNLSVEGTADGAAGEWTGGGDTGGGGTEKVVYLTFDDGPSEMTPLILDILEDYQVPATFFVTGIKPSCAEYIGEAHDAGHTIGMHTYCHDYSVIYRSVRDYYDDLGKIAQVCREQIGYVPRYIRFPGGSSNTISSKYCPGIMTTLTEDVERRGYLYCDWNCTSGDGEGDLTVQELLENAKSGSGKNRVIMLCHDGNGKRTTVDALPQIIDYYRSSGYDFLAMAEDTDMSHHAVSN